MGGNRRDKPSPQQSVFPGMPRACEQRSPSLLNPLRAGPLPYRHCSPPETSSQGRDSVYRGVHWDFQGRRVPKAACTALPAPKGTLLPAQTPASGWAERFPWAESSSLPPHHLRALTLQRHRLVGNEENRVLSGLDTKYTDTQNTQNGEENTQNNKINPNGEESAHHSLFCICLIKTTRMRGEWRKSLQ